MTRNLIIALVLGLFSQTVAAQNPDSNEKDRLYVTDQLWLSIYERATEQSTRLGQFRSGDTLLVDEISGPYALVTGPDNKRGWVKRGFLNAEPTSNILLAEEREKNASLTEENEKLGNSKTVIAAYEKDMDDMSEKIKALESEKLVASGTITRLEQELEQLQQNSNTNRRTNCHLWRF